MVLAGCLTASGCTLAAGETALASRPGDLNADESVDVSDAVRLVFFIFRGGELPGFDCDGDGLADPQLSSSLGDVSGDGRVDVNDVVYLLRHIFESERAPVAIRCASGVEAVLVDGEDWSLPPGTEPEPDTGFFSEIASPEHRVDLRGIDVTWRQLEPSPGAFTTDRRGSAQGMEFASYAEQLAAPGRFWMRLWTSGVDWAPGWLPAACDVGPIGSDDHGEHLPIWNPCVWARVRAIYREVFLVRDLRSDPRLRLVYVPGAFTWCEFDFDIVAQAVDSGALSHAEFDAWFESAMHDLVDIFNGENDDPSDDQAHKLVFTGEDYPFGPDEWGTLDDAYALDAVRAGLGIRSGITELSNFHLNHAPSYGATIAQDGHIVTDESWPLLAPASPDGKRRVIAAENECYTSCGYSVGPSLVEIEYAVRLSNLKVLQLRVNWLYVVPEDSYLDAFAEHWEWVRLSLGRRPASAPDAWVALREAEDRYWLDDDAHTWTGAPWVRNLERGVVQREVDPDGRTRRGTESFRRVLDPDNGTAWEGRRTDLAAGQGAIYFDVDAAFLDGGPHAVNVLITYLDDGRGAFVLEYANPRGTVVTRPVVETGRGIWRTARFTVPDAVFDARFEGQDFVVRATGGEDIEVRFLRIVR